MSKAYISATLATLSHTFKVLYPSDVDIEQIRVDPMDYQMTFKWPEEYHRCSATMVTDQIALTAAHCIPEWENGLNPGLTVKLADGSVYGIKEFRVNECWEFNQEPPYEFSDFSDDIAIMILDRPIPDAIQGVHYVKTWNAETMGDVVGREFILAGWGISGAIPDDNSGNIEN